MIKTILVDYAGVLTPTPNNWIFSQKYSSYYELPAKKLMDIFYENWAEAATGKIKAIIFWEKIAKQLEVSPDLLKKQVLSTYPLNQQLITFLNSKNKTAKYNFVMASNQIEDWINLVLDEPNLKNLFQQTVNSYQLACIKPNPIFFQKALKITKSRPQEVIFIDDNLQNVEAANKLEIKGIKYENFLTFKKTFNRLLKNH
jgi:FMN phosphatase YigB (HAD superfamily)